MTDKEVMTVARGGYSQEDDTSPEQKYTRKDLFAMQAWGLDRKIQVTQTRLIEWYKKWDGRCYVSFSGGKDSTVLAYLTAQVCTMLGYKLILWFSDTGMEYPEIRTHAKNFPDYLREKFPDIEIELIIAHPTYGKLDRITGKKKGERITFRDVIKKHGYPVISKEVAHCVHIAKNKPDGIVAQQFVPGSDYEKKNGSRYMHTKWKFLIDAPFNVSDACCTHMKKNPSQKYMKQSGNKPITGVMAAESQLRTQKWLQHGCNAFDLNHPESNPMSFWTEQDVLQFIRNYHLPLADVYGEIAQDDNGKLVTTGVNRTGCVFCGFGCHLEKEPNRFQQLKQTHPGLWEYCMKPYDDGGLGMKEVLEYIGVKTE